MTRGWRVAGNFTQVGELEGQLVEAKAREQELTAASEAAAVAAEATLQTALRAGRRRATEQAKVNRHSDLPACAPCFC